MYVQISRRKSGSGGLLGSPPVITRAEFDVYRILFEDFYLTIFCVISTSQLNHSMNSIPDSKKSCNTSIHQLIWRLHPSTEMLVAAGFETIWCERTRGGNYILSIYLHTYLDKHTYLDNILLGNMLNLWVNVVHATIFHRAAAASFSYFLGRQPLTVVEICSFCGVLFQVTLSETQVFYDFVADSEVNVEQVISVNNVKANSPLFRNRWWTQNVLLLLIFPCNITKYIANIFFCFVVGITTEAVCDEPRCRNLVLWKAPNGRGSLIENQNESCSLYVAINAARRDSRCLKTINISFR